MLAFSDILDFLLRLLSDDAARAEFEQDPQGALEQAGLDGVSAQDIRDARLQLADSGAVSAADDGDDSSYPDGDDPVREIGYTTQHYVADEHVQVDDGGHADLSLVDSTQTIVTIDDRDTLFFQSISDDDVTVTDNSVAISDSFNEDNSVNNLTAIQANDSFNTADSFNSDDDLVAIQDNDVNGGDEAIVVDIDDAEPVAAPALDVPEPVDTPEPADAPEVDAPEVDVAEPEPPADLDDEVPADEPADDPADDPAALAADDSDALAV